MYSTDEWIGVREQIIAEREGGFDDEYSDWRAQFYGEHERSTLEQERGAVTRSEYEMVAVRDSRSHKFVWAIRVRG